MEKIKKSIKDFPIGTKVRIVPFKNIQGRNVDFKGITGEVFQLNIKGGYPVRVKFDKPIKIEDGDNGKGYRLIFSASFSANELEKLEGEC